MTTRRGRNTRDLGHRAWTREELLLAMNLYVRIPFGRQHSRAPEVIELAEALGRTASSVAMKLGNFTSLDPDEAARGIRGLPGASQRDRAVWDEFRADWEAAAAESEALWESRVAGRGTVSPLPKAIRSASYMGETEEMRPVAVRRAQQFFRRVVKASYGGQCCVTGIALDEFLVASHIVSWAEDARHRANPANGLLLSRLHDAAFDRHLVTVDEDLRLVIGSRIRDHLSNEVVRASFKPFEGQPLRRPERFPPDPKLLERHREKFAG